MVADNFDEVVNREETIPELQVKPQELYHARSFWTRWILHECACLQYPGGCGAAFQRRHCFDDRRITRLGI